jgi:hypothetical protein
VSSHRPTVRAFFFFHTYQPSGGRLAAAGVVGRSGDSLCLPFQVSIKRSSATGLRPFFSRSGERQPRSTSSTRSAGQDAPFDSLHEGAVGDVRQGAGPKRPARRGNIRLGVGTVGPPRPWRADARAAGGHGIGRPGVVGNTQPGLFSWRSRTADGLTQAAAVIDGTDQAVA